MHPPFIRIVNRSRVRSRCRTLCTVEGNLLWRYETKRLREHALEYAIPITARMGANVTFSLVFSAQTRFAGQSRQLTIVDGILLLDVALDGERVLKPGAEFSGTLSVRDKHGRAALRFAMPDDPTKWRLVLVGSDGAAHLINFRDSLITKQDIMVKLEAPRGFVTDDSAVVTSVLHNYSDDIAW